MALDSSWQIFVKIGEIFPGFGIGNALLFHTKLDKIGLDGESLSTLISLEVCQDCDCYETVQFLANVWVKIWAVLSKLAMA